MINWYDDPAVWANMEDNNEFMQKVNLDEEDFKKFITEKRVLPSSRETLLGLEMTDIKKNASLLFVNQSRNEY